MKNNFPCAFTSTEAFGPQKIEDMVTIVVESELEIENTQDLRLDPKMYRKRPRCKIRTRKNS